MECARVVVSGYGVASLLRGAGAAMGGGVAGGADAEDADVDLSGADAQHAGEDGAADAGEDVGVADLCGRYRCIDRGGEDARDCDG